MTTLDEATERAANRTPPHAPAAEMAVLGAAMESRRALDEAVDAGLTGPDFYLPAHEMIWDTIVGLANRGEPCEHLAVWQAMVRDGNIRRLPDTTYLFDLTQRARSEAVSYYAGMVREYAAKRRAITLATQLLHAGYDDTTTADDLAAIADTLAGEIAPPKVDKTWATAEDVMWMVRDRYEESRTSGDQAGIKWGYVDVDRRMTPLRPGELAVVVAWAGGGKSVVAANLALDTALTAGKTCLVHAMEMSLVDIGQRYAAKTGGIRLERILKADLTQAEEDHFEWAMRRVSEAALIVDENPDVNLTRLRASIRKHRPDLVIVDQIPIMTIDDTRPSREQQLTRLAYDLKGMAASEKVVVVACAQLNSEPMKRSEKLPTLQDIRESRGIGQAATHVVFLHDPTGGQEEHQRAGEIDWIVRKQRTGAKDFVVPLAQQFHYSRLADLA